VAAHSVRVGLHGEREAELRQFFRGHRANWPVPSPHRTEPT
jgi:hypothetical protein